jgi:thiosulfate dehydrogenase
MDDTSARRGLIAAAAFIFGAAVGLPAQAQEIESKIARGGQLYDFWLDMTDGEAPKETHPAYPRESKKKGKATWRCKECHGWDYKGKDGYYGSGDSYTGVTGIRAMDGGDPAKVVAIIRGPTHRVTESMLKQADVEALAFFVTKGQVDMDKYIDPKTRKANGNAAKGAGYFNTICARCHGFEGRLPRELPEPLGKLANRVPWEVLHKARNGDSGAQEMPGLRALPVDVVVDILTYAQTLPQ